MVKKSRSLCHEARVDYDEEDQHHPVGGAKASLRRVWLRFNLCRLVAGIMFLAAAFVSSLYHDTIAQHTRKLLRRESALTSTSHMLDVWSDPPVIPRMKIFIYNVTNHEQLLAGTASKAIVQEIGPFTYTSRQRKKVESWSNNDTMITFRSHSKYHHVPEESVADARDTTVIVPNILLMTGMLKAEVRPQAGFLKENIVWPILTSAAPTLPEPFLRLSAHDFIWGYEDELACLDDDGKPDANAGDDDDDGFFGMNSDDDWDDFMQMEDEEDNTKGEEHAKKKVENKRNYRAPDGRCIFGALRERNISMEEPVTILTGKDRLTDKGSIIDRNGETQFNVWDSGSHCDDFSESQEPSAMAPLTVNSDHIDLFLGVMCRKIRLVPSGEKVDFVGGRVTTNRYVADPRTFDLAHDPANECFSASVRADALPNGAMSIRPCVEGSPMAVSFPHFLHGNQSAYLSHIDGMTPAIPDEHQLYFDLEPSLGNPLSVQVRFQVNLLLEQDPHFPPLANLSLSTSPYPLPVFWVQEGFVQPPNFQLGALVVVLSLPSALAYGIPLVSLSIALCLIVLALPWCHNRRRARRVRADRDCYQSYGRVPATES